MKTYKFHQYIKLYQIKLVF